MAFEFKLPDIGEGLTEGEVIKWLVKEGDVVTDDQPMVEVMTDKATVEITAPVAGTIQKIHAAEGETIPVGSVMVVIDNGGAAAPTAEAPAEPAAAPEPAAPPPTPVAAGPRRERTLAAPATRKLARTLGVDLDVVPAGGPGGRVTKADVESFAAGGAAVPAAVPAALPNVAAAAEDEVVALKGIRGKIAAQMVLSKQMAPHFTYVDECDMTEVAALRQKAKPIAAERDVKLTYLPFVVKALVAALKKFPVVNSLVDDANKQYVMRKEYHVGIATDTDAGLMVPVIKHADRSGLIDIAAELQRLTELARSRRIELDDIRGSTISITSAGSIGGILATPILNYPEVGILGVYKIKDRPVVKDGEIVVRKMMNLSITLDHRIVDGATAAHFLNEMIRLLETPGLMLLEA